MRFNIDDDLLAQSRAALAGRERIYWIVGGAGAGKTTVCRALSARLDTPIYDMDAHIYGEYHARFTQERHPVNKAWSSAPDGLAWLLELSWEEFDQFNRAALPEYLSLLGEDIAGMPHDAALIIDGGICNPALLARALPARQIVCLAGPEKSSAEVWEADEERKAMKAFIDQLTEPEEKWHKFLEFDGNITRTLLEECRESQIRVVARGAAETVEEVCARTAAALGLVRG